MIDDVLSTLSCPHCGADLTRLDGVLGCLNGHRFDIARQGYVSLLGPRSRTDTGDTADMVAARAAFLGAGHYAPIAAGIVDALSGFRSGVVLEIGAGTGYYLAAVLSKHSAAVGVALDSSARAARRAAVAHSRLGSVVADAWSPLPVRSGVVDVVLSVFAPRDAAEVSRVLRPGGVLVVVTPNAGHLAELIGPLGMLSVDEAKDARLAAAFTGHLELASSSTVRFPMALGQPDLANLALMGPSAHHVDRTALLAAVAGLGDSFAVTADVRVSTWTRSAGR